jgi:hypothetical protein
MLGTRWVGFTRRNQVKSIPIQKLRTVIINYGPQMLSGSFWKKMQKLRTAILKCRTVIFGMAARICSFKAVFSLELIDFDTPSSQGSINRLEKSSKTEKKRKNTIRRRIQKRTQEPGEKS